MFPSTAEKVSIICPISFEISTIDPYMDTNSKDKYNTKIDI